MDGGDGREAEGLGCLGAWESKVIGSGSFLLRLRFAFVLQYLWNI